MSTAEIMILPSKFQYMAKKKKQQQKTNKQTKKKQKKKKTKKNKQKNVSLDSPIPFLPH